MQAERPRHLPSEARSKIITSMLVCFPNPDQGVTKWIEHQAFEFSHLCPFTGHPDTGTLVLAFDPGETCVELKTLKEYLHQFRDVRVSYEDLVGIVLTDMVGLMHPKRMRVTATMNGRGGIRSVVSASMGVLS